MPRISESIEETLAQLDALHQGTRERRVADFAALQAIVAGLDGPIVDEEEPAAFEPRRRRPAEPPPAAPDGSWPFDEPPIQDGRPGHQFTGALRQKLIAEALDKGNW